jgi:TRAP-type C4-dicarboxylate transport system substrate-binding protein
MQLGGAPPALYDQIRDGVIDCGWAIPAYTPGRFPEAEAMELPFMTSMSGEASSMAAWDYTQAHLLERFSDVHLIAVHVHGPGVIHTTSGPIESDRRFRRLCSCAGRRGWPTRCWRSLARRPSACPSRPSPRR